MPYSVKYERYTLDTRQQLLAIQLEPTFQYFPINSNKHSMNHFHRGHFHERVTNSYSTVAN